MLSDWREHATFPPVLLELTGRSIDPAYIDVSFADATPLAMQKFLVANPATCKKKLWCVCLGGAAVAVVGGERAPVDA